MTYTQPYHCVCCMASLHPDGATLREFSRYLAKRLPPSAGSSLEPPGDAGAEPLGLAGPAPMGSRSAPDLNDDPLQLTGRQATMAAATNEARETGSQGTCIMAPAPGLRGSGAPPKCCAIGFDRVRRVRDLQQVSRGGRQANVTRPEFSDSAAPRPLGMSSSDCTCILGWLGV